MKKLVGAVICHPHEFFSLVILLSVSATLRLWRIRDYLVFLGDEGRDMIVVKNFILYHNIPFLGPVTSIGNMYLGPFYYYLITPALILSRLDPVGPSILVASLGVATVFLLFTLGRKVVSFWPAFLISFLYAVSPIVVTFSRSSWNPNVVPFFTLATIYSLIRAIEKPRSWWIVLVGLCMGILVQLHYLTLLLVFPLGLTLLIYGRNIPIVKYILAIVASHITLLPFILFNLKHQFVIFRSILLFVTSSKETNVGKFDPFFTIEELVKRFAQDFFSGGQQILYVIFIVLFIASIGLAVERIRRNAEKEKTLVVIVIWLLTGLAGLSFFHGIIYDYYLGFLFPAAFLILAIFLERFKKYKIIFAALVLIFASAIITNLSLSHLKRAPNRVLSQTEEISQFVADQAEGRPYNFALIAGRNADFAYRYFLELKNKQPTPLEAMVTDQLIVVCEDEVCKPLGHPIWEIAGFGQADIQGEWELRGGVKVFKLVHHPGAPNMSGKPVVKGI